MGYSTLPQNEHEREDDGDHRLSGSPASPPRANLFLDPHDDNTSQHQHSYSTDRRNGLKNLAQSIASGRSGKTNTNYDMLENDDFSADAPNSPTLSESQKPIPSQGTTFVHRPLPRLPLGPPATTRDTSRLRYKKSAILRTPSGHSIALRHPTPDLQTLQGAYVGNIEHLEKTAERLSMTSSIDDAIRELHNEQKRLDSRRSSLLETQGMNAISRQVSNASSIVEVNSQARSGGYSPAGFMMSPQGSIKGGSGRARSASKSSKYGTRPEPELEGRPLDSFVSPSPTSPLLPRSFPQPELSPLARTDSIPEQDEETASLTQHMLPTIESPIMDEPESYIEQDRPPTSASHNTVERAPTMFADFDGVHVEEEEEEQAKSISGDESNILENTQLRERLGNDLTANERPKSYADPLTGNKMVYYPAPVPMMLNLPQKLSKNPSSMARNKRRTQVLSSLPPPARKSAIWLPDVLDTDAVDMSPDDPAQQQEYIPQHQRAMMGGRRNTQDISHMPPQLRASTFFDLPSPANVVEMKDQSPMATLDSILDASAFAPVNAFTDHAFAGRVGAEVYGRENTRNRNSSANRLDVPKKRSSTFGLFLGRRASNGDLLEENEKRRSTLSGLVEGNKRKPIDDDDDDEEEDENGDTRNSDEMYGEDGDENFYEGAPTTLLAELQLRKQQQKQRTRPLTTAFPNGVHSTLLQLDDVARVEIKTRQVKRVNLAWEDPSLAQEEEEANEENEDIPLGILYSQKLREPNRPIGLMERRDMEDNEPLSRRRDRLLGRPPQAIRASTMMNLNSSRPPADEDEDEPLGLRVRRMKEQAGALPAARPVSGDFASEMMSQLGGPDLKKDEAPIPSEEDETLGQRRKRLQAEREARELEVGKAGESLERPMMKTRHSMADILTAHPVAAGSAARMASYQKPANGLLGLHEKKSAQRASTMMGITGTGQMTNSGGFAQQQRQVQIPRNTTYNAQTATFGNVPPMFAQPTMVGYNTGMAAGYGQQQQMMMPFANTYAMNMAYMNSMQAGMGINMDALNQGQADMVERWRQSVMPQQQ